MRMHKQLKICRKVEIPAIRVSMHENFSQPEIYINNNNSTPRVILSPTKPQNEGVYFHPDLEFEAYKPQNILNLDLNERQDLFIYNSDLTLDYIKKQM